MDLKFSRKNAGFFVLIFLSIIIWSYFFASMNLSIKELLDVSMIKDIISGIDLSVLIMFLLAFPSTIALIVVHSKIEENRINSFAVSVGGTLLGMLVSFLFFPILQEYILLGLFYQISLKQGSILFEH